MNTIANDNNGNAIIDPVTHDFKIVTGVDAYAVVISDAIRTVRGELQLDTEKGIPYNTTIFRSQSRIGIWKKFVSDTVLGFQFVKSIENFTAQYDVETKHLNYELYVMTDEGPITVRD